MQSKVKILGHPLHPILTPFPIALNTATMVCCIMYAANAEYFWFRVAFIANCAAVVMSAITILPGLIDWLNIPQLTDAKSTGFKHMVANVFTLGFFIANAAVMYTELHQKQPPAIPHVMLTVFGFLVMLYAGFKGWALVQKHHIGVDMDANESIPAQVETQKNVHKIFTNPTDGRPGKK